MDSTDNLKLSPSPEPSTSSSHSSENLNDPQRAMLPSSSSSLHAHHHHHHLQQQHNNSNSNESLSSKTQPQNISIYEFEDVFKYIKEYGRYQLFMLFVIQYAMLNAAGNYVFISFASLSSTCLDPRFSEILNPCEKIKLCPRNLTISQFQSLYEDNGFVCPMSQLPQHMQTLQAIGSGIGAIVGGHFADIFGRKWVTYIGAIQMCSAGLLGAFSTNWEILAAAMFGMGLSYGVLVDASMTLASESVGPKYRIVQTLAFQWSLALQVSSFIAYMTGTWRNYLFVINVLCAPVLGLMLFWRESPRWLIQRKKYAKAAEELNALAKWNGVDIRFQESDLLQVQVGTTHDSEKIYSIWHLVSSKKLIAYTFVMCLSALTVEMCVAVFIFDVQVLAGSPFVNIALYGLLRLWVPFFIFFMETKNCTWFGHRTLFVASQSTTALCYIGVLLLSAVNGTGVIRTVLALIGGIINSSIFFTIYKQYSIEIYPTLMRAMAVGAFGVVERVGGGLAPQLVNMNKWAWPGSAIAITTFILILSAISGAIILPETKNAAMADMVETKDGRNFDKEAESQL